MAALNFLLVEDDEVDVKSVKRAFRDLKIVNPLFHARDGIEALEMLRGAGGHEALPRPLIILLDLNMPRMGGIEFLEELRRAPQLHASIVFMMTTSAAEEDRVRAYSLNVRNFARGRRSADGRGRPRGWPRALTGQAIRHGQPFDASPPPSV